ncbi:MAG: radical SAM family heme chaperone HemW [Clostridia bacterium]|nr:radical SAM family heme chaperone HemW [Clostridia bacterium]
MDKKEIGLYVHIPFCKSKCIYCDFCSFDNKEGKKTEYLEMLKKEINLYSDVVKDCIIKTLFIGGGTPTILTCDELKDLISEIKKNFKFKKDFEFTVEANPGTLDIDKLKTLKECGVNRLSIGLQSANDFTLKTLSRIHTFEEFKKNVEDAREVGFTNINADIMFSLPNETIKDIKHTVEEVLKLNLEHISAYSLIIEEGTRMYDMACSEDSKYVFPDEDTDREIYYYICDTLKEHGYHQYEISNFAKPGYESKHNIIYWRAEEYLGLGLAAHSYLNNYRFSNVIDMNRYISKLRDENKITYLHGKKELESKNDQISEFMFLGLRMLDGISIKEFKERFGVDIDDVYGSIISEMIEDGVMEREDDTIKLTRRGIDVSNVIFAEFMQ